jgi:hypothetical protein
MMNQKYGCYKGAGATYYCLLSPLLLEIEAHVTVAYFAGFLAAERRAASSVWHLGVSLSNFVFCCRFGEV